MSDRSVKTAIQKLAGTFKEDTVQLIIGTVESVDDDKAICSVKIQNDVILPNVSLQASICDGLLIIPVVDSTVYVLTSKYNTPLVIQWSDIDKFMLQVGDSYLEVNNDGTFQFNDGSFDGLVKVGELVKKVNALENLVNNILNTLKGTTIPLAPSGTYPFAPLYAAFNDISPITQQSDIENELIKHGK